jgi:predicted small lipoprotein YifL
MIRNVVLIPLALIVAACGVQRPLMRPSEIPAYEKKQQEKREKIEQEMRDDAEKAAAEKAAAEAAGQAQ